MRLRPRPKYLALVLTSVQRAVAYRGTTLLNLLSSLIWVAVLYSLWRTVFAEGTRIEGFDWREMRTYILVSYAVNALLSFYSLARMTNAIRTGEVAAELVRPADYLGMQLAQAFGAALIEGVLGFLVKFLVGYLVALLCFWTKNAIGLIWAQTALVNLFSGALIPLAFFPDWLRVFALATPFQGIVYTPVTIYLGKVRGLEMLGALGVQALWAAALWLLARLLWAPSVRALDIQGG